jgi:hypothetical protein
MATYQPKKLSEYPVNTSPSNGDLVPSLVADGSGSWVNRNIPYSSLKGESGDPGPGLISGGSTNQALVKSSNSDFSTKWQTIDKTFVGLSSVDNTSDTDKPVSTAVAAAIDAAKQALYPVGSIYTNATDSTNPAILLGFGTWVEFAQGRVSVGYDHADSDFNTVAKQGGAKSHNHKGFGDSDGFGTGDLRATIGSASGQPNTINFYALGAINPNTGAGIGNGTYSVAGTGYQSGIGYSHFTKVVGYTAGQSSLQPYVVVYMWQRTA